MKWNYLKGGEKDFEGAPEWATEVVWTDKGGDQLIYWLDKISRRAQMPMCPEFQWDGNYGWRCFVKAERVEVGNQTTPKHLMIFGDPKSFIFAHDEATHAAKNKVTGAVIHTSRPELINLSKFDLIAQRQLTDVTESDLNECIGASESIQGDIIHLHVDRINDRLVIVDQEGRVLKGVRGFIIDAGVDQITTVNVTVECASINEDGEFNINVRG